MTPRFVFYDIETTGLDPRFAQIIQVAALRTDDRLEVRDELNLRCRLLPHVVPDPAALLATGVGPGHLRSAPFSHPEMIDLLFEKLSAWGPSHFVGHNALRFDEPFLRHAFYSTLHPPYFTQRGGNSRGDSLRLAHAVHRLAPHALTIPLDGDGRPCFALARLADANGYRRYRAHDALEDAYAVRFLCALVRDNAPDVWSYWLQLSDKRAVAAIVLGPRVFVALTPAGEPPVVPLSAFWRDPEIPTEVLAFDLRHDPAAWLAMPAAALRQMLGERAEAHIVRRLRTNAQPLVLAAEDAVRLALAAPEDRVLWEARAALLRATPLFRLALAHAVRDARPARAQEPYVEAELYCSLPLERDLALMAEFHRSAPERRLELLAALVDPRFRTLGRRLLALEHPELFPAAFHARCAAAIAGRLLTEAPRPWCTIPAARRHLVALERETPPEARALLRDWSRELDRLEVRLAPHLAALPKAAA